MNVLDVIRDARAEVCRAEHFDSFAFGLLLRIEQRVSGQAIYPAKFLPQSNPRDYDAKPSGRLTRHGYKYA
jgi:hypothetical protein